MLLQDRFGQTLTTTSAPAAEHYVAALDHLFAMHSAARPAIDQALEADPEFALAHCVDSRVRLFEGDTPGAIAAAEHALELAGRASERERQHARIVAMVARGESTAALPLVRQHAGDYPRDALPLSFALGVYSLLGFGGFVDHHEQQLALLESLAPSWDEDWWFLSWLGWSYVETGEWARGTRMLDRSLELKPDNANSAHGRAHGYYEMGAAAEGLAFLEAWLPGYGAEEPLHCHIAWHMALTHLQQGDFEPALEVYDRYIRPSVSAALPMFTMVDCAAFAWRSRLSGFALDVERLQEIESFAVQHFPAPTIPFVNLHGVLARQLTDPGLAEEFTRAIEGPAGESALVQVNAPLCMAISAYGRGDYRAAADSLQSLLPQTAALGGSHAQRDVIVDTLISALIRAGDEAGAHAALSERNQVRAAHLDQTWYSRLD
jgi:tetratricopeptide (TPR) repeat protein